MENKTLNGAGATFEFKIGNLVPPTNWEISFLVDNIGAIELALQKNVEPDRLAAPIWKATGADDIITENGVTVFRVVGGGHFRLNPNGTPSNVFVSLSY